MHGADNDLPPSPPPPSPVSSRLERLRPRRRATVACPSASSDQTPAPLQGLVWYVGVGGGEGGLRRECSGGRRQWVKGARGEKLRVVCLEGGARGLDTLDGSQAEPVLGGHGRERPFTLSCMTVLSKRREELGPGHPKHRQAVGAPPMGDALACWAPVDRYAEVPLSLNASAG